MIKRELTSFASRASSDTPRNTKTELSACDEYQCRYLSRWCLMYIRLAVCDRTLVTLVNSKYRASSNHNTCHLDAAPYGQKACTVDSQRIAEADVQVKRTCKTEHVRCTISNVGHQRSQQGQRLLARREDASIRQLHMMSGKFSYARGRHKIHA